MLCLKPSFCGMKAFFILTVRKRFRSTLNSGLKSVYSLLTFEEQGSFSFAV